jgi:hypothetical protein
MNGARRIPVLLTTFAGRAFVTAAFAAVFVLAAFGAIRAFGNGGFRGHHGTHTGKQGQT